MGKKAEKSIFVILQNRDVPLLNNSKFSSVQHSVRALNSVLLYSQPSFNVPSSIWKIFFSFRLEKKFLTFVQILRVRSIRIGPRWEWTLRVWRVNKIISLWRRNFWSNKFNRRTIGRRARWIWTSVKETERKFVFDRFSQLKISFKNLIVYQRWFRISNDFRIRQWSQSNSKVKQRNWCSLYRRIEPTMSRSVCRSNFSRDRLFDT